MTDKPFTIGQKGMRSVAVSMAGPMFVMAGPCVIESEQLCMDIAERLIRVSENTGIGIIFKASFDKANRSSISSFRGLGFQEGLDILSRIREKLNMPVVTDVHESVQVDPVAQVVDCLQIPAFLCRQTDLLCACAQSGKPVNIKKGQFMSPQEMKNVVEKVRACGNDQILLTERGTFFGYQRLVNDMTAIEAMKDLGCPVVFDATHSTQQPGGLGNASGGQPQLAPILAKSAVAAGANGLFVEVHPDPENAKSDAGCIMHIDQLEALILTCKKILEIVRT